jgi:hypothetical protein
VTRRHQFWETVSRPQRQREILGTVSPRSAWQRPVSFGHIPATRGNVGAIPSVYGNKLSCKNRYLVVVAREGIERCNHRRSYRCGASIGHHLWYLASGHRWIQVCIACIVNVGGIEPVSCDMRTRLRDATTLILGNGFMAAKTKGDFGDREPAKRLAETGLFRTHSSNPRKCRSYSVCIRK